MQRIITAAIVACLLLGASSCAKVNEFRREFDPRQRPEVTAYHQVIDPYLAEGAIYNGPASEMLLTALPLTWPVRRAMVRREAAAFSYDKAHEQKRLDDAKADQEKGLVVMLRVYVPERRYNDLTEARSSWRIFLLGPDGSRLHPVDIRRITTRSAINQALYPFWDHWSRLYRIRFKPTDWQRAKLEVSGSPGRATVPLLLK